MAEPRRSGEERFGPAETLVIGDLETLRVITDPLRLRILEAFARDPETPQPVKRIAATLGEGVTKLYYHVGLLEERGLLRATESRVVSGIIEKRYQPSARAFTVDRSVLGGAADPSVTDAIGAAMGAILDSVRDDLVEGMREGRIVPGPEVPVHQRATLSRTIGRLSPARAEDFIDRLRALVDELDSLEDDAIATQPFALTVAFHPTRPQAADEDAS